MSQSTPLLRDRVKRLEALVAMLAGGGSGPAPGVTIPATLTAASPQYTVLPTDTMIRVDVTGGQLAGPILMDTTPNLGETHTVVSVGGNPAANPILVSGNGRPIEDPNNPQTFSNGTVAITNAGSVVWQNDGTKWVIIASA